MLRRLNTRGFELTGSLRGERLSDEEWFLTRSRPFAQQWPRAGRWAALAEACRRVTKSPGQGCQAEKREIPASADNRPRRRR